MNSCCCCCQHKLILSTLCYMSTGSVRFMSIAAAVAAAISYVRLLSAMSAAHGIQTRRVLLDKTHPMDACATSVSISACFCLEAFSFHPATTAAPMHVMTSTHAARKPVAPTTTLSHRVVNVASVEELAGAFRYMHTMPWVSPVCVCCVCCAHCVG